MLLGTIIGVLVIPGLYYMFAVMSGDRKLLQDETDKPLEAVSKPIFQQPAVKSPRESLVAASRTGFLKLLVRLSHF